MNHDILRKILCEFTNEREIGAMHSVQVRPCSATTPTFATAAAPLYKSNSKSKFPLPNPHHFPPKSNKISYQVPAPTPLLLPPPPTSLTHADALDRVLDDLDASLRRHVVPFDPSLFASLLETCSRIRSLRHGERVRRLIPDAVLRRSTSLSSKLVHLYASCGQVDEAHQVFDQMPRRNKTASAFVWNALISGYSDVGLYEDVMALYYQMEEEGVEPDEYTFPRVLKACAGIGSIGNGEAVHRSVVRSGFYGDIFVLNALVDMYYKCGDIQRARRVFDMIPMRDQVSWNAMLMGYVRHGLLLEAMDIVRGMILADVGFDSVTISTLLSGLAMSSDGKKIGLQIHGWVLRHGLECELSVANSLITMYAEHNRLDCSKLIFEAMPVKDLVSWNAIIAAHLSDKQVLSVFHQMKESTVIPDQVTFVSLLSACANLGLVEEGQNLFSEMQSSFKIKPGMEHYGCMVNLLGRAGLVDQAYELVSKRMPFDGGPTIWGALLFSCSMHGNIRIGEIAADRLFELEPDNELNFELLMEIYRGAGRLEDVSKVRKLMTERGLDSDSFC